MGCNIRRSLHAPISPDPGHKPVSNGEPIADRQFEIEFIDADVEALRSRSADAA